MIADAIDSIPIRYRFGALYALLGTVAVAMVALAAYLGTSNVIVQTRTVHVKPSYGTPDQTVAGTQINPALSGLQCDIYSHSRSHTIICHA